MLTLIKPNESLDTLLSGRRFVIDNFCYAQSAIIVCMHVYAFCEILPLLSTIKDLRKLSYTLVFTIDKPAYIQRCHIQNDRNSSVTASLHMYAYNFRHTCTCTEKTFCFFVLVKVGVRESAAILFLYQLSGISQGTAAITKYLCYKSLIFKEKRHWKIGWAGSYPIFI